MQPLRHRNLVWLLRFARWQRLLPGALRRKIRPYLDQRAKALPHPVILPYSDRQFIHCSPESLLERTILLDGFYETELLPIFRTAVHPGSHCIDIGANIGCHTLVMADLCGSSGRVLAVEPSSSIRARLERNLALNLITHVSVVPCALSSNSGQTATLHIPAADQENQGAASLFSAHLEGATLTETVPLRTLDEVVKEAGWARCDFIKMDVEGSELSVLKGATRILKDYRPTLVFEYNPDAWKAAGASWTECVALLSRFGYTPFVAFEDYLLAADDKTLCNPTNNVLAIPPLVRTE